MPSPSELRALAERAKALSEQASKGPWKCDEWGYIENNEFCLGWLDGNNSENGADGALIVFAKNELSDYSDALLALLDENERLRSQLDMHEGRTTPLAKFFEEVRKDVDTL